jgi:hypothetical protein
MMLFLSLFFSLFLLFISNKIVFLIKLRIYKKYFTNISEHNVPQKKYILNII